MAVCMEQGSFRGQNPSLVQQAHVAASCSALPPAESTGADLRHQRPLRRRRSRGNLLWATLNYLDKVGKVTFAGSWPSILAYLARRSVGFFS